MASSTAMFSSPGTPNMCLTPSFSRQRTKSSAAVIRDLPSDIAKVLGRRSTLSWPFLVADEVTVELDRVIDGRRQCHLARTHDEGVQLLGRRPGMGAPLGNERDVATGSIDAVNHQIACARHRH